MPTHHAAPDPEPRAPNSEPRTHNPDPPSSAFARSKRAHENVIANLDRTIAANEALFRPTEFTARLREQAARRRLVLTPLEKRVLCEDRRLYPQRPLTNDPEEYAFHVRLLAQHMQIDPSELEHILDRIELILLRAELLGIEIDTTFENSYQPNSPLTFSRAPHARCAKTRINKRQKQSP